MGLFDDQRIPQASRCTHWASTRRPLGAQVLAQRRSGLSAGTTHGAQGAHVLSMAMQKEPTRPGKHRKSYGKLPFIVSFPMKHGDFPVCKRLPEGKLEVPTIYKAYIRPM
jgi:hypothetical protein